MRYSTKRAMWLASAAVLAASMRTGIRAADVVDRYLTKDVTAAATLDFTKLDIVAFCEEVVSLGAITPEFVEDHRAAAAHAQTAFAELPKLGARRAYIADSRQRRSAPGLDVCCRAGGRGRCEKGGRAAADVARSGARARKAFGGDTKFLPQVVEVADNAVLAASNAEQLKLLTEAHAESRDDAAEAITALQGGRRGVGRFRRSR